MAAQLQTLAGSLLAIAADSVCESDEQVYFYFVILTLTLSVQVWAVMLQVYEVCAPKAWLCLRQL